MHLIAYMKKVVQTGSLNLRGTPNVYLVFENFTSLFLILLNKAIKSIPVIQI